MDGLLIIDKPAGMTSHDVVARVRRMLKTRRVGHTGTLDPFATGVLVLMVGKATRLAKFLDKDRKEYIADVQFGSNTDTGDVTGTRNADSGMGNDELVDRLRQVDWNSLLSKFRGRIMQTPPMYSAKKIEGRRLYELAREGKSVERKPVAVAIHELEILPEEFPITDSKLRVRVTCSAGTYIRTLAEDIGASVEVGAHLIALRRTAAGEFDLGQSIALDIFEGMKDPTSALLRIERAVSRLTAHELSDERIEKTRNGLSTRVDIETLAAGENVRLIDKTGDLVAIGVYDDRERSIRPTVVLI